MELEKNYIPDFLNCFLSNEYINLRNVPNTISFERVYYFRLCESVNLVSKIENDIYIKSIYNIDKLHPIKLHYSLVKKIQLNKSILFSNKEINNLIIIKNCPYKKRNSFFATYILNYINTNYSIKEPIVYIGNIKNYRLISDTSDPNNINIKPYLKEISRLNYRVTINQLVLHSNEVLEKVKIIDFNDIKNEYKKYKLTNKVNSNFNNQQKPNRKKNDKQIHCLTFSCNCFSNETISITDLIKQKQLNLIEKKSQSNYIDKSILALLSYSYKIRFVSNSNFKKLQDAKCFLSVSNVVNSKVYKRLLDRLWKIKMSKNSYNLTNLDNYYYQQFIKIPSKKFQRIFHYNTEKLLYNYKPTNLLTNYEKYIIMKNKVNIATKYKCLNFKAFVKLYAENVKLRKKKTCST